MKLIEENPQGVEQADVVVGIPSLNEADVVAYPTLQADKGLTKFFGDRTVAIINCDNASPDGTRNVFLETKTTSPKIYLSTPDGITGKGNNVRNLFIKAQELSAKAVIVVDADVANITPRWIHNLGEPLFQDFHFVAPLYVRHKYDGAVNSLVIYPLSRALYGRRVRQPIGGDFGFSGDLAKVFAESEHWSEDAGRFGIDIWMTTTAVRNRFGVVQSFLGRPKVHRKWDPIDDEGKRFKDVIGTTFELMIHYDDFWKDVKWSRPTAVFGFGMSEVEVPPKSEMNLSRLREFFRSGLETHRELYHEILASDTRAKIEEAAGLPDEGFEFPTALWAKVLYDAACAYRANSGAGEQIVASLIPLYCGKALSFAMETESMNNQQVEELIEDQCLQFEKTKPYLIERWMSI
jgi:glycosyltransferase involved in cell wall biosynthesis